MFYSGNKVARIQMYTFSFYIENWQILKWSNESARTLQDPNIENSFIEY